MRVFKSKLSPLEKELQKIEREEGRLIRSAQKHKDAPSWKAELENKIPEKVMSGLSKRNCKDPLRSFRQ